MGRRGERQRERRYDHPAEELPHMQDLQLGEVTPMARRTEPDGPSITNRSLTPERHANAGAKLKAARYTLARVCQVVAEEPFQTPGIRFHGNALADATIERQLCRATANPARGAAENVQAEAPGEVQALPGRRFAHAIQHVHVGIERQGVVAETRDIVERKPRLERQQPIGHEAPADIDGCPDADTAATRGTAAAVMAIRCTEIHTDFVLRSSGG